jgi:CelD/BcsL family acetyltransferase involved in cellulose biosynthesis
MEPKARHPIASAHLPSSDRFDIIPAAGEAMDRTEVIRTESGFEELRTEWDALLAESRATFFQSWEWQRTWWRHFGRGRLYLWTWRRGDRLLALAPLMIRRHFGLPLREVVFCGTGISDYLNIVSRPEEAAEAASRLLADLARDRSSWDLVDLQQLRDGAALLQTPPPQGLRSAIHPQEPCPFVSLPGTWEEYAATLGKKLRSNIGYYERLMARTFTMELDTVDDGRLEETMEALFRLHQRRWRGRGLPGAFVGGRVQAFHREVAKRLAERGWLRLHALRLDGQTRAVLYCFSFMGSGYYYQGGFEPALARYSPGTVLTARAIQDAIHDGAHEFDFLRGDEPYKYLWKASDRWNQRFVMWKPALPSSWTPKLIALETRIEHRVKQWARNR